MIINRVENISTTFKGIDYAKNSIGEDLLIFNWGFDPENETCETTIFKVDTTDKYNYKISPDTITTIQLKPEGTAIKKKDLTKFGDCNFAYFHTIKDKNGKILGVYADTGNKIKPLGNGEYVNRVDLNKLWENGYEHTDFRDPISNYTHTLFTTKGTTPIPGGAGYLAMVDTYMPEAQFKGFDDPDTGSIYIDENIRKRVQGKQTAFPTRLGGNLAGIIYNLDRMKENGIGTLFLPPIANGDDVSGHGYWAKNNNQISKGNSTEHFKTLMRETYKKNMRTVFDGTFTSAGLESIYFQNAMKYPQAYYWFRMRGFRNQSLGLGAVPKNKENMQHRVINSPFNYELQPNGTYKKIANKNYNPNKETLIQIYDASLTSEEQLKLDNPIRMYENLKYQANLDINTHDDTLISYVFQIDPKEYNARVDVINDLNKKHNQHIKLDSPEGTLLVCQFSNFRIDRKTEGGFVTWDANTDMAKMNYYVSGYDEKALQSIVDETQRYHEQQKLVRGTKEVQDMAIQTARYWTELVKDTQISYSAQKIGMIKSLEDLNKLIEKGELPKLPIGRKIDKETFTNILNGQYLLEPKDVLDKDSITLKALMKLPLDSLEFGENVQGLLTTSYFSNRATTDETIGKTRFELFRENNPHLVDEYAKVYNKVDSLYTHELKDFADAIIKEVDRNSNEKLLDSNGNYTEYGEYIINIAGSDIVKYALLKSLAGDNFRSKILNNPNLDYNGVLTYDYKRIKEATTLKALGINAYSPEDEAMQLQKLIKKGLKKLTSDDVATVARSINISNANTCTFSYRLGEVFQNRAALGLCWRLDACKDIMDQDSVRNRDDNFDNTWNELIKFWSKMQQTIKEQNPNAYIVAEMTDVEELMRDTTGNKKVWPYNGDTNIGQKFNGEPDAMAKFFNETGITTEAGYAYFFTDLLTVFSNEFESGTRASSTKDSFKNRLDLLLQTRSIDYLRNLYTFMGNQDKPRMIHGLAIDMSLFHSSVLHNYDKFSNPNEFYKTHKHRMDIIRVLSGAKNMSEVPIELRLNVDNNDYFRTVSSMAVAQSKLLMDSVYEDLNGIASPSDIKLIAQALADLANGNYLKSKISEPLTVIDIPELSSIEKAAEEIFKLAKQRGLNLSEQQKQEFIKKIVEQINSTDLSDYSVYGDFDWLDFGVGEMHKAHMRELMGSDSYANKTDLYVMQLARLINDSYAKISNSENSDIIKNAAKDFVIKYNKDIVNQHRRTNKFYDQNAMKENGYASRDFVAAMKLAIEQAEFKSGRSIRNKDEIIAKVFQSVTEPAVQKAAMIMEFLKGLIGIPTMYAGDELGLTGYEEKAKNIYLQNRLLLPFVDLLQQNAMGEYRNNVYKLMTETLKDRSDINLHSLNDGTPYSMDVVINSKTRDEVQERIAQIDNELEKLSETDTKKRNQLLSERKELIKSLACVALLRHSANGGDVTISLFNAAGVNPDNRHNYFDDEDRKLDTEEKRQKYFKENNIYSINPNNKYVPILPKTELDYLLLGAGVSLPAGMILVNSNKNDKSRYIVKVLANGKRAIVKEGGGKIIMDGLTSRNGVMILTNAIKKIAFRGSNKQFFNKTFNIVSNPYENRPQYTVGQKLSVTSR